MIELSVFNEDSLKTFVREIYGINVGEVSKINRGSANIYSLNNDEYIVKEFQSKYTEQEIIKEIEIINYLKKDNLLVPEYIATKDGKYYSIYEGKIVIIQKFISGYTLTNNSATKEQMLESARILANIVTSLKNLRISLPTIDVVSWFSQKKLQSSIDQCKDLMNKANGEYAQQIKKDMAEKIQMLEFVKNRLDLSEMKNLTCMNTHGDYNLLQFIYNDGKVSAVIDFVSACKMPIVWEIIRSYSYIDPDAKNGDINVNNLVEYVKEFTKIVKLNRYDIKYMAHLYLVQLLNSNFGYKQYIADNSKLDLLNFGFFRTNVCRSLFNNLDKITDSNQLISE